MSQRMNRTSSAVAVLLAATAVVAAPTGASASVAAGTLDAAFGAGGISRHHFAVTENASAVVALADDSAAVAGLIRASAGNDRMAVMHVSPDGGTWAQSTLGCSYPGEGAVAISAASPTRLVVAGYSRTYGYPDTSFCVGAVDPSSGAVIGVPTRTSFPGHAVMPRALAVGADGSVLVVGDDADQPPSGQNAHVFAAHYLANGALDTAFGNGGLLMLDLGGGYDGAGGVIATSSGFVVLATDSTAKAVLLTRLTATGAPDASFGSGGLATMVTSPSSVAAKGLLVDATGGLVVSTYAEYNDFGIVRFTASGARDTSYGTGGGTRINFGSSPTDNPNDTPSGLVLDEAGRVVIGGTSTYSGGSSWVMARLLGNGLLDSSFGSGGTVHTPIAVYDGAHGLAIDNRARLLQTGTVDPNTGTGADVAVARFIGGSAAVSTDVAARIVARAQSVVQGGTSTYDIGAQNLGLSTAANVVVRLVLPTGSTLGVTSPTCSYAAATGEVSCPLGSLPAGGQNQAFVTINVPASQGATLTTSVTATSDTADPATGNNRASTTVDVIDVTPPTAQISSPVDGATYQLGATVASDYSCSDDRAIATCVGPVPSGSAMDTSALGSHTFTVQATDTSSGTTSSSVTYSVVSTTTATLSSGGTVSTTTPVDSVTPVGTSVVVPSGLSGTVTIIESGAVTQTPPATYTLLGQQLTIEAPIGTWDKPLALTFTLDQTILAGQAVGAIAILRDGVPVADCPGASQAIAPTADAPGGSPCVSSRQLDAVTGDGTFTVLTPHASTWNFARPSDVAAPTITIARPADGASYTLRQNATADYSCRDEISGSGLATCTGPVASGAALDTSSIGTRAFTVTATDYAGNRRSTTVTYRVVYAFRGFLSPVVNPPTVNVVSAGKGVPLRFSLSGDMGPGVVSSVSSAATSCPAAAPPSKVLTTVVGDGSLRYTTANDQYEYRWGTQRAWLKTCRSVVLTTSDGTTHSALFLFN